MTSLETGKGDSISIEEGLDFIVTHLEPPIWPRRISTRVTGGRQVLVQDKGEALAAFKRANLFDCRINAYPFRESWALKLLGQAPDFIFIDEDESNFKSRDSLDIAHERTLKTIKKKLNGAHPTVLWSGNGYHTEQPIQAFILEHESVFEEFQELSTKFLRFTEIFLSTRKADPVHSKTLSCANCLLRIPGSHNSKLVESSPDGTTILSQRSEVKIIQKWDGVRPAINWLLRDFRRYLIQDKIDTVVETRKSAERPITRAAASVPNRIIYWIESLLETPLSDYRKYAIWRIITPYLINVKKLSYDEALATIKEWLDKCNSIRKLSFDANCVIKNNLHSATRLGYLPLSFTKLRIENKELHDVLVAKGKGLVTIEKGYFVPRGARP